MRTSTLSPPSATPASPRKNIGLLGVGIFVISESMFFLGLFLAFFYLRATARSWPPVGVHPPSILPALFNTCVVLCSMVCVWLGNRAMASGDRRGMLRGFVAASALGVVFMAVQIAEFADLALMAQGSSYGSSFTFLLLFHVLRVFVGVTLMVVVVVRGLMGQFSAQRRLMVQGTAFYWFFITSVWLVVFTVLYLVR